MDTEEVRRLIKRILPSQYLHPEWYHKPGKNISFEGWYYKYTWKSGPLAMAVIPGVYHHQDKHAFIQVLDGWNSQSYYYRFPYESFKADPDSMNISIGKNYFSSQSVKLELENIRGELIHTELTPWRGRSWAPSVMDWYIFVPFMQCYHGVVSMDHRVEGQIYQDGVLHTIKDGNGYIEKDWGRSFPKAWIWIQCNDFENKGTSLFFSLGDIPWIRGSFTGFLGGLYHDNELLRFATYTGADYQVRLTQNGVEIQLRQDNLVLKISGYMAQGAELKSPLPGKGMAGKVQENMRSSLYVTLYRNGKIVWKDESSLAAMEVSGPVKKLI